MLPIITWKCGSGDGGGGVVVAASSARDLLFQTLYIMRVNMSVVMWWKRTQEEDINPEVRELKLWPEGQRFQPEYWLQKVTECCSFITHCVLYPDWLKWMPLGKAVLQEWKMVWFKDPLFRFSNNRNHCLVVLSFISLQCVIQDIPVLLCPWVQIIVFYFPSSVILLILLPLQS